MYPFEQKQEASALEHISGALANKGPKPDSEVASYKVITGRLEGIFLIVFTDNYSDGSYRVDAFASNGLSWKNTLNGNWELGHVRREEGSFLIKDVLATIGLY